MAYRIPLTDPRLIEREERAISDLQDMYPDGRIVAVDSRDKSLGKRLSSLYPAIGYDSRADMLEAWGFEIGTAPMGRRPSLDPEAVLAELQRRYEGREKPQKLGILIHDNPDLAGKLKSINNKSNELFGQTLARELTDRGILMREKSPGDVTDDELRAMVDALEARYRDDGNKLGTVAALKAAHPEYKIEFAALASKSELVFGMGQRELLVERGILRANRTRRAGRATGCTDEEVWEAIDQLGAMLSERPDDEKPKTVAELAKSYPEQGPYINEGKARGLTDKGPLQELGILQRTTALVKRAGVRRTPPEQMGQLYVQAGGVSLIEPDGSDTALLPRGVCGLDVEHGLEMRELLAGVRAGDAVATLAVGDALRPVLEERSEEWNPDRKYKVLFLEDAEGRRCPAYAHDRRVYDDAVDQSDSPLAKYTGGEVLSIQTDETAPVVLVRLRVLSALRTSTLAHALRAMGYIDERDVRGSMAWRYRIWHAGYTGERPAAAVPLPSPTGASSDPERASKISLTTADEGETRETEPTTASEERSPNPDSSANEVSDEAVGGAEAVFEQEATSAEASTSDSVAVLVSDEPTTSRPYVHPDFSYSFCEKPGQAFAIKAANERQARLKAELAEEAVVSESTPAPTESAAVEPTAPSDNEIAAKPIKRENAERDANLEQFEARRTDEAASHGGESVEESVGNSAASSPCPPASPENAESESERIRRENAKREERLEQLKVKWAAEAARREGRPVEDPAKTRAASSSRPLSSPETTESESERIRHDNAERADRMTQLRAKWAAEAARREGRPYNAADLEVDPPKQLKSTSSKDSSPQAAAPKKESVKQEPQRNTSPSVEKRAKTTATPAKNGNGAGVTLIASVLMWVVCFGLSWMFSFGNTGTAAVVATIATVAGIAGLNSNKK